MLDDGTALVPAVSIENLVAKRNATIARIREAHRLLEAVEDDGEVVREKGGSLNRYRVWSIHLSFSTGHRGSFTGDKGVAVAIKKIDAGYWSYLLSESGMQSFLDATARAQWRDAIEKENVPELTVANIEATFSALYATRGEMFERGIVELFRKLSWQYKTNQPVKFGKRLVLRHAVSIHKYSRASETYGPEHGACDKFDDLLRVMRILDKKPELDHRNASWAVLNGGQWMRTGGPQIATVHDYFEVKGFKNGNAHLTFLRLDLVDELNRIIAKAHPDALPPGSDDH